MGCESLALLEPILLFLFRTTIIPFVVVFPLKDYTQHTQNDPLTSAVQK